jgi:adenylate cyclase
VATAANAPSSEAIAWLTEVTWRIRWGFARLIVATLLARWARIALGRRKQAVAIDYSGQRTVHTEPGNSILEVSRTNGIPHAAVCGGRGRCSTCRVRVGAGLEDLPPPSEDELKVLRRIGAAPNVRLACQARPTKPVAVTPLLPPHAPTQATNPQPGTAPASLQGQEREIAVMFIDIRGFTSLAEHRLPYDVVFILNRYFAEMGYKQVVGVTAIGDGSIPPADWRR